MGIRNVGAILKTLASWVAAEGFRMTEPLIHAVVRQLVHRADFEMVDEGLQMLSIEPVGAGLNVFAGQECLHRDTDFFSPDRLPGANLGGLNGAAILQPQSLRGYAVEARAMRRPRYRDVTLACPAD